MPCMCHATGFSPFFLMYGRIPILPIDVEFGVMVPDIMNASHQNYVEKLKVHLKWAYKVANKTMIGKLQGIGSNMIKSLNV